MPVLTWIGKDKVINHDKELAFKVLKPVKALSVGKESKSLLIEGDNLEALKALMPFYHDQVKCIYIDPPYNTGNEKWAYNDKVNSPHMKRWLNSVVKIDDLERHDKWLCMMYPRLKLLRDLLSDDGVIFISIDDNEIDNLRIIMDEIFGENNFVTNIIVKMSHLSGVKMSHLDKKLPKLKEYILMFAKNKESMTITPAYEKVSWENAFARYKSYLIVDKRSPNDVSKWKSIPLRQALIDSGVNIENIEEVGKFYLGNANKIFRTARNRAESFTSLPNDDKFREVITATGIKKIAYKREEIVFASYKLQTNGNGKDSEIYEPLGDLWTDIGINNLHNEGGVEFRFGKKPLKLLKRLIQIGAKNDSLVLDSFAGSGSTGQAVLELNKEDGGKRNFILVELENDIARKTTYKRLKNTIYGHSKAKFIEGTGQDFQYLELNGELYGDNGFINPDAKYEDLAGYIYFTETKNYLDLAIIRNPFIGSLGSNNYFLFYEGKDKNILDEKSIKKTEKYKGMKVIYADKCLLDEEYLGKNNITFKQIPYELKKY